MLEALLVLLVFCAVFALVAELVLFAVRRRPELHDDDHCGENGMQ